MQQNPPPWPPEQPAASWGAGPHQSLARFSASLSQPADSRSMQRVALKYGLIFGLLIVVRLALGSAIILTLSLSQYRGVAIGVYVSGIITQAGVVLLLLHIVLGTAVGALGGLMRARSVSNRKNFI